MLTILLCSLINSLFKLLIICVLLYFLKVRFNKTNKPYLIAFAMVFIMSNLLLVGLMDVSIIKNQQRNWVGKIGSIGFGLLFIYFNPLINKTTLLWNSRPNFSKGMSVLKIAGAYFLFRLIIYLIISKSLTTINAENLLYQASLPGIDEEIIYRSILLGLLSKVLLVAKEKKGFIQQNASILVVSILFGLSHGLNIENNFCFNVNIFAFVRTFIDGYLFALIATKTKSIWPAMLYHNLLNLIGNH